MFNRIISSRNHVRPPRTTKKTLMCTLDNSGPCLGRGIITVRPWDSFIHFGSCVCVCVLCNPPRGRCGRAVFSKLIENKLYTRAVRSHMHVVASVAITQSNAMLAGCWSSRLRQTPAPPWAANAADFDPRSAIVRDRACGKERRRRRHQIDQSIIWVNGRTHSNWIRLAATAIDVETRARAFAHA